MNGKRNGNFLRRVLAWERGEIGRDRDQLCGLAHCA